ncbi:MAG: Crp/Fnr family transcriptional regulator [Nitrospirae bacterium]|uniref:Crp/Fnr family transcriptional regulator n=1 Tax=Candidatus Magnetobacterium casense TaxID=1455061 RepID=UPI00058B6E00|nr:Crp/Fnr family transcriptional regulator [Candidatus Magnetobacterium casensis]MBF0337394.1 Crp/Fnr family transcriptional regulator [Nitrospirota bacterium]
MQKDTAKEIKGHASGKTRRGKGTKAEGHDNSLQCLPCLAAFSADELSSIESKAVRKNCCRNDYLFWEGDEIRFVFVVESGHIKLFKTSEEGREIVIRIMRAGDYFCCAPIYADRKNMVNAIALEDTSLVLIPTESFHENIYAGLTPMGTRVLSTICDRVKHLSGIIESLTFKDVVKRVLMILLNAANDKDPDSNIVTLSLTHQEMASMIGTVREVVSRTMSRLRKQNIVLDSTSREFKVNKQLIIEALK